MKNGKRIYGGYLFTLCEGHGRNWRPKQLRILPKWPRYPATTVFNLVSEHGQRTRKCSILPPGWSKPIKLKDKTYKKTDDQSICFRRSNWPQRNFYLKGDMVSKKTPLVLWPQTEEYPLSKTGGQFVIPRENDDRGKVPTGRFNQPGWWLICYLGGWAPYGMKPG